MPFVSRPTKIAPNNAPKTFPRPPVIDTPPITAAVIASNSQGDMGYQNNHREEWSAFHTHYGSQPLPQDVYKRQTLLQL